MPAHTHNCVRLRDPPSVTVWHSSSLGEFPIKKRIDRWAAVSIVCTSAGCAAVQALKGRRYLSADAPRLPLSACTLSESCRCIYRKYADRRAGPRREVEESGLRRPSPGTERRRNRGRRRGDL